jgi:hypothetical protein
MADGDPETLTARIERALASRWAPVVAGAISAALLTWFWGGLDLPGAVHDERSYLVQARLLAAFSWTAPTPPVPAFWEMAHVFVEPALFSKYPPGHAPLLVPGVWLGMEGLMPVLFAAASAGMVFALARRLAGGWVALITWGTWTAAPQALAWHATYFSQVTTTPLWLLAVTALVSWRERERPWLLATIVGAVAWIGITRPVTGIALGIPIAAVVLWTSHRRKSLAGWQLGAVVGAAICAIVPYWAWRTMGSPTTLPYIEYSHVYFPFDLPGFVRDTSPPLRALPPDLVSLGDAVRAIYTDHTPDLVPMQFITRLGPALTDPLGALAPLLFLVPVGAVLIGGGLSLFAAASFVLLIAAYLMMPQPLGWTIYSLELFAITPFFVAVAVVRGLEWGRRALTARGRSVRTLPTPAVAAAVVLAVLAIAGTQRWPDRKRLHTLRSARQQLTRHLIAELPEERVVVFVRRTRPLSPHFTLWDILGPPQATPVWIVRDLGEERNAELIALADGRRAYLLDEISMTISAVSGSSADATARAP